MIQRDIVCKLFFMPLITSHHLLYNDMYLISSICPMQLLVSSLDSRVLTCIIPRGKKTPNVIMNSTNDKSQVIYAQYSYEVCHSLKHCISSSALIKRAIHDGPPRPVCKYHASFGVITFTMTLTCTTEGHL